MLMRVLGQKLLELSLSIQLSGLRVEVSRSLIRWIEDLQPETGRNVNSADTETTYCQRVKNLRSLLDLFPWKNTVTTDTADSCKSFSLSLSQTVTECGRVHT